MGRSSPDLLLAIRRCRERREIALDLYEQLDAEPTPLDLTVSLRDDPEAAAGRIRALLDISFEVQRSWQDQYEAFRQWRTRLESAGALAFQATDVEIAEARGFSVAERPLPAVVVNTGDGDYMAGMPPRNCAWLASPKGGHRESGPQGLVRIVRAGSTRPPSLSSVVLCPTPGLRWPNSHRSTVDG